MGGPGRFSNSLRLASSCSTASYSRLIWGFCLGNIIKVWVWFNPLPLCTPLAEEERVLRLLLSGKGRTTTPYSCVPEWENIRHNGKKMSRAREIPFCCWLADGEREMEKQPAGLNDVGGDAFHGDTSLHGLNWNCCQFVVIVLLSLANVWTGMGETKLISTVLNII